ncbi:hypothetical protein CAOG_01474 [Capsaspora owczarzaki ATCC 30864]|uniref:Structural maintenance of chromosomes protein n=1 Tax=Capsaspora owczarzaki (strain ATCC 30864) TaxID=595528 RepID=A0A0D2WJE0_CAPO3|nr:hypothetical protein CAOG_01474 [Capsaspora owczarzaki ATCC 30864]KJE90125.1 hypothetical protein CAOG_001474 [Capsaspora owczarzaki ATCC 30864]|eukprot:XP_004364342.1 hypothetical protein CAOG_01474 [Capsaspora owczarzaki ATCC 30864]
MEQTNTQQQERMFEPTENGGKRLMITKMVLENFKSYAGVQEIGPFHKSFSSVVGPNGSGKSNVIDAMLFVFAFRANRLRQKNVSELIHNSTNHKDLKYCRVSVHFHEIIDKAGDEYDVVPNSQFVVTRTGTKSNTSSYHIDTKSVTAKEVIELLSGKGIDLEHNRFLILQGEVEQIAMMKPKAQTEHEEGLLEYLEDIIGSDKHKEPIAEASKIAEELNEVRAEKLNRVKIVQKDREGLEGAKNDAVAFLQLENELARKKAAMAQIHLAELTATSESLSGNREKLEAKLAEQKSGMAENAQALKALETEIAKEGKEHSAILDACNKAKADFVAFERKDISCREDIKHARTKEKKLESAIQKEQHAVNLAESSLASCTADKTKLEKEHGDLQKSHKVEAAKLDAMFDSIKGETAGFQAELEAKQQEMVPLSKAVGEAQSKHDVCKTELALLDGKSEAAKAQLDAAQEQLTATQSTLSERQEAHKALLKRQVELTKKISESEASLAGAGKETEAALQQQVAAARAKVEEGKASILMSRSRGKVLDGILDLKRRNKIAGIEGRLGDLGTIDAKYDVAVTTACGALDNIVVDNQENAEACVKALRENNLGRATFVILSELGHLNNAIASIPSQPTPEGAPRLFELVKPRDKKLIPAFYHAMRDTLVANDLDQAMRISTAGNKRWRVVTLGGELLDVAGTMGGGGAPQRGGMITSASASKNGASAAALPLAGEYTPKQVEAFEAELEKKTLELKRHRDEMRRLEQAHESLLSGAKSLAAELDKCTMDVSELTKQCDELKRQIKELTAKIAAGPEDPQKHKQLTADLGKFAAEVARAQQNASKIQVAIDALQSKIMDVGGMPLRVQRAKVQGLVEQIDIASKSLNKLTVTIKSSTKAAEKAAEKLKEVQRELEETGATIQRIGAEHAAMEKEAVAVLAIQQEATALLEAKEATLSGLKSEYDGLKKQTDKARALEVDLTNQIEDATKQLRDATARIEQYQLELASLTLHNIEAEGMGEESAEQPAAAAPAVASEVADAADKDEESAGNRAAAKKKGKKGSAAAAATGVAVSAASLNPQLALTPEQLATMDRASLRAEIALISERLAKLSPNISAIREYRKKEAEYLARAAELEAVTDSRDAARGRLDALRKKRLDEFMAGFSVITMKLKEMYQMITLGGDAELELVDSLDPFSEGIVFSVRPPKKSWKNISNLSGGEKTLSSLALVFALHHYKPTPLYVMDEIDAALDFKNVSIVANYIKERTKNAQFIIISLRNNMFELADRLVGIYKTENCTKSVTINPVMVANAALAQQQQPMTV